MSGTVTGRGAFVLLGGAALLVAIAGNHALPCRPAVPHAPSLVRYEDGSGVLYQGDQEVATYPADTFVWHCASMGNRVCGDVDDADVQP